MAEAQPKNNLEEKEDFVDELKPGTKLMHGQYTIESFLNAGGFGITYLARDSLDRKVVIKECFPGAFCRRSRAVVQARSRAHQNELKSIVRLFVQEARSLAKLDHPNIVGVHQVFEDNDTAYMALDFVRGRDLLDIIEDPAVTLTPAQIKSILKEVLGAVGFIHDQQILHRDISPDNILINKDFHPVLIDFGAAREEATKQSRVLSALRVVKDGYSPQEFYIAGSDQSPSSDLYALAASFHHLIAGDVPPNSQARLAAIASGEPDPYEPIVGRFEPYDDNFLRAIDKALAVLPKDRLQSAQEWLDMMEGISGNVTALNVTNAAAADATAAAAQAAPAKKSNMPLLLGSAAAVALLVGVGVVTMSGGEDDAAAQAPAVTETVVATPAPAADTAVETQVETQAATVVEDAPAAVEEDTAAAETETAAADPVETAAAEETATAEVPAAPAEETVADTAEAAATDAVEAPAAETAAAAEEVVAEETATMDVAVSDVVTPDITADPAPVDTTSDTTAVVAGPEVTDTPTPVVRPAARPQSVELAAVPAPVPLPEPAPMPTLATDAPAAESLPQLAATAPAVDGQTAAIALPSAPDGIDAVGDGPVVDILAVTPGNEIIQEPETPAVAASSDVSSAWTVRLPFTPAAEGSNVVARAAAIAPVWVQPGIVITSVNGTAVASISEIPDVLRAATPEDSLAATIPVLLGTANPADGSIATQPWVLPVVQNIALADGTVFEASFAGADWRTVVTDVADGAAGGLQVGDVISSYIATAEPVNGRTTLAEIFNRELNNDVEQFTFAVQRDGSLWIASYTYGGAE